MFQVRDRMADQVVTVFSVHKSGPADDQTKFLVHRDGAWRWMWASCFEPVAAVERPTLTMRRGQVAAAVA